MAQIDRQILREYREKKQDYIELAEEQKKQECAERKREALDTVWKANNYIFKQCACGTKLKFPQEYMGQEISCPHCKALIKVENDENHD